MTERPVEFSADEVKLVSGVLRALCRGQSPWVPDAQVEVLTEFARKLEAIGVPPLDPSELREEGDAS
jgi:hypothetical protein